MTLDEEEEVVLDPYHIISYDFAVKKDCGEWVIHICEAISSHYSGDPMVFYLDGRVIGFTP